MKSSLSYQKLSITAEDVSSFMESYVEPTENRVLWREQKKSDKSKTFFNTSNVSLSQTFTRLPQFSVTHDKRIYPSSTLTKDILEGNKEMYRKLMLKLKTIERDNFNNYMANIEHDRARLTFFKKHTRGISKLLFRKEFQNKQQYSTLPAIEEGKSGNLGKMAEAQKKSLLITATLPAKWRECETHGWRPESREGATLTTIMVPKDEHGILEERIYLFGGLSRGLHSAVGYLKRDFTKPGYVWTVEGQEDPHRKRYGHAAVEWERKLVIVGGSRMYSKETKRRECLGDILIYNPVDQKWSEINTEGAHFDPRRYLSACMVGKQLLVYGGINGQQVYCSDLLSINICKSDRYTEHSNSFKWMPVRTTGASPGKLAYHSCQLVLHPDRYRTQGVVALNSLPDIRAYRARIDIEGVYFFGGRDEKRPNNNLYVLKIGQKVCEWLQPSVDGVPPMPRYGHSIDYYPSKDILILFGGRNDENFSATGDEYLDDVWVLSLGKLTWTMWNKPDRGTVPAPRFLHASAVINGSVVVFGGLGASNYCRSSVYVLDMDSREPKKGEARAKRGNAGGAKISKKPNEPEINTLLPMMTKTSSISPEPMLFQQPRETQNSAFGPVNSLGNPLHKLAAILSKATHKDQISEEDAQY